ncbi:MAG: RagB/SusD family nutrient uptake outer membrane protein [Bacteroidales bacterium]|nr:RagB/SusD family nutrient uptake outer membrane protein [Bacteroidales bacterium]
MKKIFSILVMAAMATCLASCEKALDFQNRNGLSTGMFWKTQDDLNSGLNAVYNMFYRQGTWTRNIHVQLNGMADDGVSYAGWTEVAEWTKFKYTDYSFWEVPKKIWAEHYTAINRANQVLDHIDDPNIKFDSEDARAQIKAEALWLRSFYYFYLTILWDTEPLCLHTSSAGDKPSNSTPEATFAQLEKDLLAAIEILPARRTREQGRPSKGAAYALLAKVYAQQHKWEEAAECLEWIVDGEGKAIYDLVDNWHDNFDPKTEDNKESIYEIHFSLCNYVGFDQTDNYLDPNAQLATQLEHLQSPKGIGWNNIEGNRWVMEYFKREKTTEGKNDPRLYYTLWYAESDADFPEYGKQLIYDKTWEEYQYSDTDSKRVFIKKYSTDVRPLYYFTDNNYRSIRLADMLLLYAEVLNEINNGPTDKAIALVDRVRQRVKLPALASSQYYTDPKILTDYKEFKDHIKIERGLELAFECIRWMDLKRWGFTEENVAELRTRDADYNNFVIGKNERFPLPQIEVDNNPNLTQNPNY